MLISVEEAGCQEARTFSDLLQFLVVIHDALRLQTPGFVGRSTGERESWSTGRLLSIRPTRPLRSKVARGRGCDRLGRGLSERGARRRGVALATMNAGDSSPRELGMQVRKRKERTSVVIHCEQPEGPEFVVVGRRFVVVMMNAYYLLILVNSQG